MYVHTYINVSLTFNAYMLCSCEIARLLSLFWHYTYISSLLGVVITDRLALHQSMGSPVYEIRNGIIC